MARLQPDSMSSTTWQREQGVGMIVRPVAIMEFNVRLIVMVMGMLIMMLNAPTYVFVIEGVGFPNFPSQHDARRTNCVR